MEYFKIAKDIDNKYYENYLLAKKAGVNFLAYRCFCISNSSLALWVQLFGTKLPRNII